MQCLAAQGVIVIYTQLTPKGINLFYNLGISLYSAAVGIAATRNNKARLMKAGQAQTFGILAEKVMCLGFDGAAQLYRECHQVDFASMGHTPLRPVCNRKRY